MLKSKNCGQIIMLFMYKLMQIINYMYHTILERLFY